MFKSFKIDEVEYKRACKEGAESLINKDMRPYVKNAEVMEAGGDFWLSYHFNEFKYRESLTHKGADYLNGFTHTIV